MQVFGKDYTEQEILYALMNLCFQISTCTNEKYKETKDISAISEEDKVEVVKQMGVRLLTSLQAVKDTELNVPEEVEAYTKMVEDVFADAAMEEAKAQAEAEAEEAKEPEVVTVAEEKSE